MMLHDSLPLSRPHSDVYRPRRPRALYVMPRRSFDLVFAGTPHDEISRWVDLQEEPLSPDELAGPTRLEDVELLFTSWGSPPLDAALLDRMPALRAVFYGGGSIRHLVTEEFWARGILITSAYMANAVPVAEYAQAAIFMSLKKVWHYARTIGRWPDQIPMSGGYQSTVGLVSLGAIGGMVADRLRNSDLKLVAYDPFADHAHWRARNVRLVSLEELFAISDVVSLHCPWLKETEGLVTGSLVASMKAGATLINTARGAIIRESELAAVLRQRDDLTALLDVTLPEPPRPGSPLYELPNIVFTPHVAGSRGSECKRVGAYMAEELIRFIEGRPLHWSLTREDALRMA